MVFMVRITWLLPLLSRDSLPNAWKELWLLLLRRLLLPVELVEFWCAMLEEELGYPAFDSFSCRIMLAVISLRLSSKFFRRKFFIKRK